MSRVISGVINLNQGREQQPPLNVKVNIATPAYGSTYSGLYVRSLFDLMNTAPREGVQFSLSDIDYADVVMARNYLISNFYFNKPECSHLLFLDDDMGFDASLIYQMLRLNQPLVGTLYPKRQLDLRKLHAAHALPFEQAYAQACEFVGSGTSTQMSAAGDGFTEVKRCGTGVMLISRQCIDTMIRMCPAIVDDKRYKKQPFGKRFTSFITPFNKIELEDSELSEDYSFCYRWTEFCQGKIYAATARRIRHMGQLVVETSYADRLGVLVK